MENLFNPISYIDRHLEPLPLEGCDAAEDELNETNDIHNPLETVSYDEAGKVALRSGAITVYYEYEPVVSAPKERYGSGPFGVPEEWRELSQLVFVNEETGKLTELEALYPEAYDTIFRVADNQWQDSYHDFTDCRVIIGSPLVAPSQFTALLHEVGHAVDKATNPYLYTDMAHTMERLDRGNPVAQSMILMRERNAWAFALNAMRPFLSHDPSSAFYTSTIQDFIHRACLRTYSDYIRHSRKQRETYLSSLYT